MNTQNKKTKININTSSDNGNYCDEDKTTLEGINNSSEIESENTQLESSNNTVPLNQETVLENVQIECPERIVKNSNSTETEMLSESEISELHTISTVTPTEVEKMQSDCTETNIKNSNSIETESTTKLTAFETEKFELDTINNATPIQENELQNFQSDCIETTATSNNSTEDIVPSTNIKNSDSIETKFTTKPETSATENFELGTINNVTQIEETELKNFQSDCTETTVTSNNITEKIVLLTTKSETSENEKYELDTINNVTQIEKSELPNFQSDCTETTVTSNNSPERIVPSTIPKRNHADNNSLLAEPQQKKEKLEDRSNTNAVSTAASQSKDSITKSEKNDETVNVRKDDHIALIVNGDPITNLTNSQVNIIERRLTEAISRSLKKKLTFQLAFHDKELLNGRYRITCANSDSKNWLIQTVRCMGEVWIGSKLRVMVNQCCTVRVLLPNFDDTYYNLVDLIKVQNPGIETDLWKFIKKIPKLTGNLFVLGINKESLDFIEANEGELFYGIGVVRFRRQQRNLRRNRYKNFLRLKQRSKRARKRKKIKKEKVEKQ